MQFAFWVFSFHKKKVIFEAEIKFILLQTGIGL